MRCQVANCPWPATVRCENGFRYCERHMSHEHTDGVRNFRASSRAIGPDGDYLMRKRGRRKVIA